jgi:hypothetical protein
MQLLLAWALACALSQPSQPAPPQAATIRVFVFTQGNAEGFSDPDLKRRQDSVNDLANSLRGKKDLSLVDNEKYADLTVEVMGRGWVETGSVTTTTTRGGRTSYTTQDKGMDLAARLSAGEYSTAIHSDLPDTIVWRAHARNVANKIEKWIKENRVRLLERRKAGDGGL